MYSASIHFTNDSSHQKHIGKNTSLKISMEMLLPQQGLHVCGGPISARSPFSHYRHPKNSNTEKSTFPCVSGRIRRSSTTSL